MIIAWPVEELMAERRNRENKESENENKEKRRRREQPHSESCLPARTQLGEGLENGENISVAGTLKKWRRKQKRASAISGGKHRQTKAAGGARHEGGWRMAAKAIAASKKSAFEASIGNGSSISAANLAAMKG